MLCTLGDLTKDISYYKRAWKLSNKRYPRAQRSLARHFYNEKNYDKSEKCFEKALLINSNNTSCWFTLGFIQMIKENHQKAIACFAKLVQINPEEGQAWANLSGLFMKLGKMKEAYSTIEQASKIRERDWRVWYNYMMIGFQARKYPSFIKAIDQLIDLNCKTQIESFIIKKLNVVAEIFLESAKSDKNSARQTELIFIKIKKLFEKMGQQMPEKDYVWEQWANFQDWTKSAYELKL